MIAALPWSRRALLTAAPAGVAGWLTACSVGPDFPAEVFRIASGGEGGVYYAYAHGIANVVLAALPRLRPVVLATAASVENLRLVSADGSAVGFATADVAADAYRGAAPFAAALPVVALARIYENYLHLAVRRDLRVTVLAQLRGAGYRSGRWVRRPRWCRRGCWRWPAWTRAGTCAPTGWTRTSRPARWPAGRWTRCSSPAGYRRPRSWTCPPGYRSPWWTSAGTCRRCASGTARCTSRAPIPASAYGLGTPTATVGVPNFLVVQRSMPQRLAYRLVRALFEHRGLLAAAHPEGQRLDRGAAIATDPLPLHPGAVRYYREAKN